MSLDYVISADSHIIEPLDLWEKALGKKWGDKVPRVVSDQYQGQPGSYYFFGYDYIDLGVVEPEDAADSTEESSAMDPALADKVNRSNADPALRLELMEMDGVQAEIVNSTFALLCMRIQHPQLVQDACQVYNDWIVEYCSHDRKRLLASGMLPTDDVDWAVAELERLARKDMRTVFIYTDVKPHMPPYRDRYYDRLWAAAADLDIPITMHIITGRVRDPFTIVHDHERGQVAQLWLELFADAGPILANEFIFGGIFDRHPKLKLMLGEYEICWLPWFLFRTQQLQGAVANSLKVTPVKKSVQEYLHTQGLAQLRGRQVRRPCLRCRRPHAGHVGLRFPAPAQHLPPQPRGAEPCARQRRRGDQGERGGAQLRPPLQPRYPRARTRRGGVEVPPAAPAGESHQGLGPIPPSRSGAPSLCRDSPGLSGINRDEGDSSGFHGSMGTEVTVRTGQRAFPSTASSMRATISGESPFRGLGFAASAAFRAACSRWTRSLSVPSMRFSTSESRARSAGETGSFCSLRCFMVASVMARRFWVRMGPTRLSDCSPNSWVHALTMRSASCCLRMSPRMSLA